jgi:hypothetical protein
VQFPDLGGVFSNSHGPAEMLSLEPRFGNACSNPLTEDFVLESREDGQKASHGAIRRRRQIERFGERYKSDTRFSQILQSYDQIDQ